MIRVLSTFLLLIALGPLHADWTSAIEAFDQGQFEHAYERFDSLRTPNQTSAALEYNLGNAAFRMGRPDLALAHYRRAQWLTPSDPDLKANLNRAVDLLGAEWPDLPLSRRLSRALSYPAWSRLWFITLALTAAFGSLSILFIPLRNARAWVYPLCATALAISLWGRWAAAPERMRHEGVLQGEDVVARFEPVESSTRHFALPGGSVVHIEDHARQWVRIRSNDTSGWIPRENIIAIQEYIFQ